MQCRGNSRSRLKRSLNSLSIFRVLNIEHASAKDLNAGMIGCANGLHLNGCWWFCVSGHLQGQHSIAHTFLPNQLIAKKANGDAAATGTSAVCQWQR